MGKGRDHQFSRRRFLLATGGGLVAATMLTSVAEAARPAPIRSRKPAAEPARIIDLCNPHTGENLREAFWEKGGYVPEVLHRIDHMMRDFRSDETHSIDPRLVEILHRLGRTLEIGKPIGIVSGYRSPETNYELWQKGTGVAKGSYHQYGMAVDVRIQGVPQRRLHSAALSLGAGGVGNYPQARFVHLDTGPVRRW